MKVSELLKVTPALKNQKQEVNNMSKTKEVKSVPFFARFIEKQQTAPTNNAPLTTLKFPSDWEDGW